MYEIKNTEFIPENFFAGDYPVKTDVGPVKDGAAIRKHAPVVRGAEGIEEFTADMLPAETTDGESGENVVTGTFDTLLGIAAEDSDGGEVVYYLTGEFFGEALILPDGVTAAALKPAFRKLGIFLKGDE